MIGLQDEKRLRRRILRKSLLFVGTEVEKPAYGMKTLFVDGVQDIENIMYYYAKQKCEHIFFGAKPGFNPELILMIIGTNGNPRLKNF